MELSCKFCHKKFLKVKGLINFCSITCKSKFSSSFNKESRINNIKFFSSLTKNQYSKIWIKSCRKCAHIYCSRSNERNLCYGCNPKLITQSHCLIYIGKCRNKCCNNLATRKNSYKKVYCKSCSKRSYFTKELKKTIPERKISLINKNRKLNKRSARLIIKKCQNCSSQMILKQNRKKQLYCNFQCCVDYYKKTGVYSLMGKKSVQSQVKRSKNEILLANLLQENFLINTNYPVVDNWDCDIFIKDYNLAILWDGQWHRKQISKTQSLHQIQNRDKIKRELFVANGINIITINDYGKFNKDFVFEKFEQINKIITTISNFQINIII